MSRGDLWWGDIPSPIGRRPVVLVSRQSSYGRMQNVIVALVSTRIRGTRAEVLLGPEDGLDRPSAGNLENIFTINRRHLNWRIASLSREKMRAVDEALRLALDLSP